MLLLAVSLVVASAHGQTSAPEPAAPPAAPEVRSFLVEPGTRIPLNLINSVSTKNAAAGDRVYLETAFPVVINGRIVIPPGSYIAGSVTEVKRPGRVKGKGELYVRFDSLTLPNGVTRDFRARISGLDGRTTESLDRQEGKVISDGNKTGDLRTIGETAVTGTWVGTVAGAAGGRPGLGAGMGAAAGATAAMIGVLLTRGPDAVLAKGTTIEMVLDRQLQFEETELEFGMPVRRVVSDPGIGVQPRKSGGGLPGLGRRPGQM
jgi:hypothetical protein